MTKYNFTLYVAGYSTKSLIAIKNLKELCTKHIIRDYSFDIVDILENPEIAEANKILVTPLLIKKSPLPIKKVIGDMTNSEKVMKFLGIKEDK